LITHGYSPTILWLIVIDAQGYIENQRHLLVWPAPDDASADFCCKYWHTIPTDEVIAKALFSTGFVELPPSRSLGIIVAIVF
jgi:hypothetical protein